MGNRIDRLVPEIHAAIVTGVVEDQFAEVNRLIRENYRNIVGALREHSNIGGVLFPIILTANLPAGSAKNDGRILIEDTGTVGNLIVYARGTRYRFTGVA